MKAYHLTTKTNPVAEAHPIYKEAYNFARELNKLTEGKDLNQGERFTLFTNIEQAMTKGGGNRTMMGKAGEMASVVGTKIKGLAQSLQDTTPIKGVDSMFDDLKQKASTSMGKSTQGSSVLRALDSYKQIVQKHPNTSKFFWGVAGVLTGLLTGGAGPVVALGAIKMIDSMVQGKQFSTSVGAGLGAAGTALGAKALATGADAAAQGVSSAADAVQQGARSATDAVQNFDPNTLNPFNKPPVTTGGETVVPGGETVPGTKPVDPTAPVAPGAETQTIVAKQGDTMTGFADKYKVNPDELAKLNPGKFGPNGNPNVLSPGDQIVLPKNIDAAAYKGAYQGDNAMTAQNINAKTQAGQYGSDGGMSAKAVAKAAAGKATAQVPAPSAQSESYRFKAGRGVLEGIQLIVLPTVMMVDKESTVQKWALNESLGRKRNSVQLNETGVMTLFMNLQRIDEAVTDRPESQTPEAEAKRQARKQARDGNPVATDGRAPNTVMTTNMDRTSDDLQRDQTGGTVYNRPADGNNAAAQDKAGNPANTSNTAGPKGGLPGGNVGGLATGTAPAGNTMPYLAADPEGKFDTKYKGGTSTGASRGIETGLGRAGNWIKDKWKDMTTKVTAAGLERHWKDANEPTDSDQIAQQVLQRLKVPNDVITQVYQQLGLPAPNLPQVATDAQGNARTYVDGTVAMTGGIADQLSAGNWDRVSREIPGMSDDQLMQIWQQWQQDGTGATPQTIGPAYLAVQQQLQQRGLISGSGRSSAGGQQGGAAGGQQSQAAAQREIDQEIDDVMRSLLKMDNRMQPAMVKYIRDRLDQHFPAAAAAAPAQQATSQARPALGPQATNTAGPDPHTIPAPVRTGTNESRKRTYGGKYVRESADQKLAREFENFLLNQE